MSNDRPTIPIHEAGSRLHIEQPPESAAGIPSILSTLEHVSRELGVWRGSGMMLRANQPGGFDCPSCAWPDPQERSRFEFCENGAKAVAAEGTVRRAGPAFFRDWSIGELSAQSDHWLEAQGRLTHPMIRRAGARHYEPISWDAAFETIAAALKRAASPDRAVFYTSGRTSNEAAFLYQLFVRAFGTNNLPDCSNMCHESSGHGLGQVIGVGKGTVTLECFQRADLILVIGQNPGTNHPRMLSHLEAAARKGCRIISINPLREAGLTRFKNPQTPRGVAGPGTALAERHLQVRINGDVAALKGIAKAVLEHDEALDRVFIDAHTAGFEAYAADLRATTWEAIEEASGLTRAELQEVGAIYAASERVIACWAMGLTQHKNGVANVQSVVNLLLLRGNIGRPGAGVCPVRGHSNVQGDRSVGITARPKPAFLDRLGQHFGFEPPREDGLDVVQSIEAMLQDQVGVFVALGGNFLNASPDTERTAEALRRCKLTVQVSTKLNRSHLVTGEEALILPCLGRTEVDGGPRGPRFVTVENSMGVVHRSQGNQPPASDHLRSEPEIVAGLAHAVLGPRVADFPTLAADYDRIRDAIAAVSPEFAGYNDKVRADGGFALPNPAREGRFDTPDGKAHFTVHPIEALPLQPGELLMMTIRSHDQFNTTIYGLDDRYRGIRGGRRVVFMNADDITARGLRAEQVVDLVSEYPDGQRRAPRFVVVPYDLPRACCATYFPETNVLVPLSETAAGSNTPASKSVVVRVVPTPAPDAPA